ncbi:unnamed protein product [Camellia sinensis]
MSLTHTRYTLSQTNFPLFRHDQASPRSPPSLATGERDRRTSPLPPAKHQRHLITENAMAELGRLLMYEASRDSLPTITWEIRSPMGPTSIEFIDPREPVVVRDLVTGRLLQIRAFLLPITGIVIDPTEMKLFSGGIDY